MYAYPLSVLAQCLVAAGYLGTPMLDHMAVQEHPEARAVFQLVRISSRLALWSFSQDEHSAGETRNLVNRLL